MKEGIIVKKEKKLVILPNGKRATFIIMKDVYGNQVDWCGLKTIRTKKG